MAIVAPFAAFRYDVSKAGPLEDLLTQPYDKITSEMQRAYLSRSPHNLAHVVKGETRPSDSDGDNVYTRAKANFQDWLEKGILTQLSAPPAFYAYFQEFRPPAAAAPSATPTLVRKSFIGLARLEDYDQGVVFRHEQTLSAPKADRLQLLRATRTQFEQIFMLYRDPERRIDALLDEVASGQPWAAVQDEYGVVHRLWDVTAPGHIRQIQLLMRDKALIIADGHHRYETALRFRDECRAARPHPEPGSAACAFAPVSFVNSESEGLLVLPTHRLVSNLPKWEPDALLSGAARFFQVSQVPLGDASSGQALTRLQSELAARAARGPAIGAVFSGSPSFHLFQLRSDLFLAGLLPDVSPAERSLDVLLLHRLLFALCLGMEEEAIREEKYLTYVRDFSEGARQALTGTAQACFFLNPVHPRQVIDVALQGRVLPQKSTDFYPKLLSGLVIYRLDC